MAKPKKESQIENIGETDRIEEKIEEKQKQVEKDKKKKVKDSKVSVVEKDIIDEKKEDSKEFPEFEIGFDPFQDQTAK